MAAKKRKTAAQKKRAAKIKRRIALWVFLLIAGFFLFMYANAHIVHVEKITAKISNYPTFLKETKILFVTDLKLSDQNDADKAIRLMKKLMETKPDIVVFGGDFTHMRFTDAFKIQSDEGMNEVGARLRDARKKFFVELKNISPEIKKYAVSGDGDSGVPGIYEDCALGNVKLIENWVEAVSVNSSAYINLIGFGDYAKDGGTGFKFRELSTDEVNVVVCHNPESYRHVASVTDGYGNAVADLVLAGHTLGGQINIFGMNLLGEYDGVYESGIYNEAGPNMIVSAGVGTNWLPLRLGSRAEATLVTLTGK